MLFDLPVHTPTPAIIYTLGTLYTSLRIEKKRLMYLHRLINKYDASWTKMTLLILDRLKLGWAKTINETLSDLDLPTDFSTIRSTTRRQWKNIVNAKIEKKNRNRLLNDCHKTENNIKMRKTKTARIVDALEERTYVREPVPEILLCDKQETKTILIARFGMLECGKNFKNSMTEQCKDCNVVDDENHRLNNCVTYRNLNLYDIHPKVNFIDIFSSDITVLRAVIGQIEKVWNVKTAHGSMNK